MDNLDNFEEFNMLYQNVKRKFKIYNYDKKMKYPYAEEVLSNYYYLLRLFKNYGVSNYLENDLFQLLFVKMIFDGTMDSIECNFEYLKVLNEDKGVDILSNVNKLVKLFSYRNYSLINCPLPIIELSHSLILDCVASEQMISQFGEDGQFAYYLERLAVNKEIPKLFWMCFPFIERGLYTSIEKNLAEGISFKNAIHICDEMVVAEVMQYSDNVKYPTLCSVKVEEDFEFLKNRYTNLAGFDWPSVYYGIKGLKCYYTLIGSFSSLFKRLESINKNLYGGSFNIFDYFMKPENLPLFDEIVCGLTSFIDYTGFKFDKAIDYNEISVEIVNELSSKLHLYSYLHQLGNDKNVFIDKCRTVDVLKIVAQLKKDELEGKISKEKAIEKFNRLFEKISDVRLNRAENIDFFIVKSDFNDLLNSSDFACRDIDDKNIGIYLMMCDDYFKIGTSPFLGVNDFIVNTFHINSGLLSKKIRTLIELDPNLLNILEFDFSTINNVEDILRKHKYISGVSFIDDLKTCAAYDFEDYNMFVPNLSGNTINAMFDAMAIRYHSRIRFSNFYNTANEMYLDGEKGIYQLKELFRLGKMNWNRDRIHVYNYFAYLENNLAHDVEEHVIDYYFKNHDYFSKTFSHDKHVIDSFLSTASHYISSMRPGTSTDDLVNYVYLVLEKDTSIDNKISLLENYIGCHGIPLVSNFLSRFSNKIDSCLLYLNLLKEQQQNFKLKSDYAYHIIIDFYDKLKQIRISNGTFDIDNMQLSSEEQKEFYAKYGYLIDIRYDINKDIPVLYVMDKYMDIAHSIHLKGVNSVTVPSFSNKTLILDRNVDDLFKDCHLKVAMNNRQNILIATTIGIDEELYNKLEDDFNNAPDFMDSDYVESIIRKNNLFPNFPEMSYYVVCHYLKVWNEMKISGLVQEKKFGA